MHRKQLARIFPTFQVVGQVCLELLPKENQNKFLAKVIHALLRADSQLTFCRTIVLMKLHFKVQAFQTMGELEIAYTFHGRCFCNRLRLLICIL